MKMILKIAKKELRVLFYSPVAWILLLVFVFQTGMLFAGKYYGFMKDNVYGDGIVFSASSSIFLMGLWGYVLKFLYFYIPLLTMGLISKELQCGSIKLLYAAPVTNRQIVLGKFCSMVGFALVLCVVLSVFIIIAAFTVHNFELPMILTGLFGLFLLTCTYAAVGIFVSSLTSYQFVAALGSFMILMLLGLVGGWGQEYDFVRDVTYWLSINGRAQTFLMGMICSEDLLYFPLVTALFLALTIIRLNAIRQKVKFLITLRYNLIVILGACLIGYLSSRPKLMAYYDTTSNKMNTLSEMGQEIVGALNGGLKITAYSNVLYSEYYNFAFPDFIQRNRERFSLFERFKPETELKVVYYYDSISPQEGAFSRLARKSDKKVLREMAREFCEKKKIDFDRVKSPEELREEGVDLRGERTFVWLIERENGQKTWLRTYDDPMDIFPHEVEITMALKRVLSGAPKIGFVQREGVREIWSRDPDGYSRLTTEPRNRRGLMNQGFEICSVDLNQPVPSDVQMLTIPELRIALSEQEIQSLRDYVARGGNLFILGEPRRQTVMNPLLMELFGVELVEGTLVQYRDISKRPEELYCLFASDSKKLTHRFKGKNLIPFLTTTAVKKVADKGFQFIPILKTDTLVQELKKTEERSYRVWNELESLNYSDKPLIFNSKAGEVAEDYYPLVALTRNVNNREQRIVICGDVDCFANHRIVNTMGEALALGIYHYLSEEEMPLSIHREGMKDSRVDISEKGWIVLKWGMYVYAFIFLFMGVLLWFKRHRN